MLLVLVRAARIGGRHWAGSFRPPRRDGARIGATALIRAVATVAAMAPVPKHVHGHEGRCEKYPDPVLCEPVHVYLFVVKSSFMTQLIDRLRRADRRKYCAKSRAPTASGRAQ
jgi:hypothetical protein